MLKSRGNITIFHSLHRLSETQKREKKNRVRESVRERVNRPFLEVSICKASKSPHIAFYLHNPLLSLSSLQTFASSLSYFYFQVLEFEAFGIVKHAEKA